MSRQKRSGPFVRTEHLRQIQVTQRDHHRARSWAIWAALAAVVTLVWPSIMTFGVFILVFIRLGFILWRWADAMERRSEWRNRLAQTR